MFNLLKFLWLWDKSRFAEALACFPATAKPRSARLYGCYHYALFRLGLYRSAAVLPPQGKDWKSWFAAVVSNAACGEFDRASSLLVVGFQCSSLPVKAAELADALLPFAPDLALSCLPATASVALRVAAFDKVGDTQGALATLDIPESDFCQWPELHLFRSNVLRPEPHLQLVNLNRFLYAYGLAPLSLVDQLFPPGARNLRGSRLDAVEDGPLVSILMTSFRSRDRIGFALDSLLAQTYRNIEIVVVDDASDDDTAAVVRAVCARDSRVRFVPLPVNVGTYVAKSLGLQLARGEFVTCHDSDDWAHPQKIASQMQPLLDDEQLVYSTSYWVRIQDDGLYYARPVHPLLRLNPASPLFRKRQVLKYAGGWDFVRTGADSEFLARLQLVFGRKSSRRIVKPLTFGAHHPDSLMNAAGTGYDKQGMSPTRLDYWESWGRWHIDCLRVGRPPRMDNNLNIRPFPVPESIRVEPESIRLAFAMLD